MGDYGFLFFPGTRWQGGGGDKGAGLIYLGTSPGPTRCGCRRSCDRAGPGPGRLPAAEGRARGASASWQPVGHGPHRADPAAVVVLIWSEGFAALYWIRQGRRDFRPRPGAAGPAAVHDRHRLAVVPVVFPEGTRALSPRGRHWCRRGGESRLWMAGYRGWFACGPPLYPGMGARRHPRHLLGDRRERRFYAQATGHANSLTAADYLEYPRKMRAVCGVLNTPRRRAATAVRQLRPSGTWYRPFNTRNNGHRPPGGRSRPPPAPQKGRRHSVFHNRHGGAEMSAGCSGDDQIGLATHWRPQPPGVCQHADVTTRTIPGLVIADGPWVKVVSKGVPAYSTRQFMRRPRRPLAMPMGPSRLLNSSGALDEAAHVSGRC